MLLRRTTAQPVEKIIKSRTFTKIENNFGIDLLVQRFLNRQINKSFLSNMAIAPRKVRYA
jgi:hypothetical protein